MKSDWLIYISQSLLQSYYHDNNRLVENLQVSNTLHYIQCCLLCLFVRKSWLSEI